MAIHSVSEGSGKPLLLVHGLGSSNRAWSGIAPALAAHRELILIDLPGHGASAAEADSGTFAGLARSLDEWLELSGLAGVDMVGSSLGARLVLELARRGRSGITVALDPGGFWEGWERGYLNASLSASLGLLRALRPALPALGRTAAGRTMLLPQLSFHPWALDGDLVADELESFADTPTFGPLIKDLAYGPMQQGPSAPGSGPVVIGWGRHDRLCLPVQAARAQSAFPEARLVWFERSGHFPMWDEPDAAAALILESIG